MNSKIYIKLLRRGVDLEKIGDIIEFQTEINDPCDFDDEDDEDYIKPSVGMVEVRGEVEEYIQKKYYDYLVELYGDLIDDCE